METNDNVILSGSYQNYQNETSNQQTECMEEGGSVLGMTPILCPNL